MTDDLPASSPPSPRPWRRWLLPVALVAPVSLAGIAAGLWPHHPAGETVTAVAAPAPAPTTAPAAAPAGRGPALCIGDSVMLGASPQYLGTLSMCATVDAAVGRQFSTGPVVVEAHRPLPAAVVIHLGTNGTISPGDMDRLMGELAAVPRVVLVTVQLSGGRAWEAADNRIIRSAPGRYPNVRVADWKAASDGHPGYLRRDGIHLTAAGGAAYAAAVAAAL